MGQDEILRILEKFKKPMSRKEIALELDASIFKVSHLIRCLLDHHEIKCIEIDRLEAKKMFGENAPCRRMRLYYL